MKRRVALITVVALLLGVLVACVRSRPEVAVRRAADPGIDFPLAVGEVDLEVLDARLRNNFQVSYIMHYPQSGYRFLELTAAIHGAEAPLDWGEEYLVLMVQGAQQDLYYRRPISGEAGLSTEYLFIYQVPANAELDKAYLQLPAGDQVTLAPFAGDTVVVQAASPVPDLGTVGGGSGNRAAGRNATVAGGSENSASAAHATIAGGAGNSATVQYATIGGGEANTASGTRATVGGGHRNSALQLDATVSGGARNSASGTHATVGGGSHNEADGRDATVSGGLGNAASGTHATVAGGAENHASGFGSTVGGGAGNLVSENHATVAGGLGNEAAAVHASVGGGNGNRAIGAYATVPGGLLNEAAGTHSLAAGQRAHVSPEHTGAFLYADSIAADFNSAAADEFAVRATGGVRFVTGVDGEGTSTTGAILPAGSGAWSSLSAQWAKAGVRPVDPPAVLALVTELPVSTWYYREQDASVQHMGPMAEDFAVFGLGDEEGYISSVDADGISLAAIQGLHALVEEQGLSLADQEERIEALEARLASDTRSDRPSWWAWMGVLAVGAAQGALLSNLLFLYSGVKVEIRVTRPATGRHGSARG
jgi:hypothetical protein